LVRLADYFHHKQKLELSPADLRDEGITRAKTYLKKVAGVKFPDTTAWQDIATLNYIRNIVVHGTGNFPENHPRKLQIEALIAKWPDSLSVDKLRRFEFNAKFIKTVIETFETFLKELFTSLKEPT
jgi:hypothetical protein